MTETVSSGASSAPAPLESHREDRHEERRHEDRGREARRPKRRKSPGWRGHIATGALISTLIGGGGTYAVRDLNSTLAVQAVQNEQLRSSVTELAKALKEARDEQSRHLDEQTKSLESLRICMVEIRTHGDAADRAAEHAALELQRVAHETVELGKTSERAGARIDEHERRLQALENQGREVNRAAPR